MGPSDHITVSDVRQDPAQLCLVLCTQEYAPPATAFQLTSPTMSRGDGEWQARKGYLQDGGGGYSCIFFCWFKHKKHMSRSWGAQCPHHKISISWRSGCPSVKWLRGGVKAKGKENVQEHFREDPKLSLLPWLEKVCCFQAFLKTQSLTVCVAVTRKFMTTSSSSCSNVLKLLILIAN